MRDRDARCSHARLLFDAHLFLGKNKPFLNVGVARRQARCVLRSEEHTSELQSQSNLVCRLLLEKKKQLLDLGRLPGVDSAMSSGAPAGYHHRMKRSSAARQSRLIGPVATTLGAPADAIERLPTL